MQSQSRHSEREGPQENSDLETRQPFYCILFKMDLSGVLPPVTPVGNSFGLPSELIKHLFCQREILQRSSSNVVSI